MSNTSPNKINKNSVFNFKRYFFILSYAASGVFTTLFFLGSSSDLKYNMVVYPQVYNSICTDAQSHFLHFPFQVRLDSMNEKEAYLTFKNEIEKREKVAVNHPVSYKAYDVYLKSVSQQRAGLMFYKQTYKNGYYAGIFLMFLALASLFLSLKLPKKRTFWIFLASALSFTILYMLFRYQGKKLPPVLESVWFIPHIMAYICAYAMIIFAMITGIIKIIRRKIDFEVLDQLFGLGFIFLTLGLLFGSLWAKKAWGDFWTWDIKEIWALITWICGFFYLFIRYYFSRLKLLPIIFLILTVCAVNMTYFGVKYFPAAKRSLHVYN